MIDSHTPYETPVCVKATGEIGKLHAAYGYNGHIVKFDNGSIHGRVQIFGDDELEKVI